MSRLDLIWIVATLASSAISPAQEVSHLHAVKRIYVAPFVVHQDATQLRKDVISELRKLTTITIVPDAAQADAVLGGDGEIWVKGYQSLNPRSLRLPSDGTPYYSGFLSLELKNTQGDTLWSYLVTPSAPSPNISKELSKRVRLFLDEALEHPASASHP